MALAPHVFCKNPECSCADGLLPIPLPYPNQPKTNQHPSVWPPAYFEEAIACPECDRVFVYKKQDVRWLPIPQMVQGQAQKSPYSNASWWLVTFDCGGYNCKIRVGFLAMTREGEAVDVVHRKLPVGAYEGKCKSGHHYMDRGTGPYMVTQFFEFEGS
jgi:uncharacterized Zn-finger protein